MVTLQVTPDAEPEELPKAPRPRIATTRRAAVETLVGTLVWTVVWAFLLQFVLEAMMPGTGVKRMIGYTLYLHFPVFALGAFMIWIVLLLALSITGRLWLSCGLMLALVLLLGTVNRVKIRLRQEPFYTSDLAFLGQPKFLFSMVRPWQLVLGVIGLVLVVLLLVRLGRRPTRAFRPIRRAHLPRWWWTLVGVRVVVAGLCVAMLGYAAHFNDDGNKLRLAYEKAGVTWAWWFQTLNYQTNTLVGGMLYNQLANPMARPPGYGEATMRDLAERWKQHADDLNRGAVATPDDVNIVVILSEAFSDPRRVQPAKIAKDPIPFTRDLMTRTTSGDMLAQLFGGGTANMEFEVLSGQSLAQFRPQVNTPYQQFVHELSDYPTVVGYLKRLGHRAIAIHPYFTAMYQRERVYRTFGFDEFVHDTTMQSRAKLEQSPFISDKATFDEVLWQLEDSSAPVVANVVTMQNHYPMDDLYDDPWPVSGVKGFVEDSLGGYARGLNYTDKALQDFLGKLSRSKEKTAVVFYGDHLPGFWDDKTVKRNGIEVMHATPWFLWTNFESKRLDTAPMTSPVYFMPLLFEQMNVPLPPYYALLHELYQELPAVDAGVRFDSTGRQITEEELSPRAQELLRDYRLVQYDLSIGERYSQDELFYPAD